MRVLVMTKIFPNAAEPLSAPFNRQQIAALGRRCDVEVLAPIPWFPGARLFARWSSAGLYGAALYRELRRRKGQFDVLLGTWAYPDGVAAVALGRAMSVPTVVK